MHYELRFEVPDELDVLIDDIRRKWVADKLTEMVRELIVHEAVNGLERVALDIKPVIEKTEE